MTYEFRQLRLNFAHDALDQVLVAADQDGRVLVARRRRRRRHGRIGFLPTVLDDVDPSPAGIAPRHIHLDGSGCNGRLALDLVRRCRGRGDNPRTFEDLRHPSTQEGPQLARHVGESSRRLGGPFAHDGEDLDARGLDGGLRTRDRDRDERPERVIVRRIGRGRGRFLLLLELVVARNLDVRAGRVRDRLERAAWGGRRGQRHSSTEKHCFSTRPIERA